MEIKYDSWRDEHAVEISSDHESAAAPSQANSVADQHTSLMVACDSTGTTASATITTTVHQTSSSERIKHGPSHSQQADDHCKHGQNGSEKPRESMLKKASKACLGTATMLLLLSVCIIVTLISWSLALLFTSTVIPGIIICLVLAYMITSLHQFARCDDHADLDDEYDTELGSYRHDLVLWMIELTGIFIVELLVYLALFRIGPFALRKLSLLGLHVWKWFLIGIIVLVYFCFWLLTHIVIHEARDKISRGFLFRVHVLPILKGLLGVAVCGFYFLVELLIIKLVPSLRQPKILGLYAHKWIRALVYVFIGLNVSQIISASVVAMLQKQHKHDGKFDYNTNDKEGVGTQSATNEGCIDLSKIASFMCKGCRIIMSRLFRSFDTKRYTIYVVIGLSSSINFVVISTWLLVTWIVTWISHFEHQLMNPSHNTRLILRVGTGTLICLLICAILWLVKDSVMLWWKYRSMYNKFYDRVLKEGVTLYLLGMTCGQHLDVLKVGWNGQEKKKNAEESRKRRIDRVVAKAKRTLVDPADLIKAADHQNRDQQSMNSRSGDDRKSYQPGIYAIMRMVKYFLGAGDTFKSIEDLQKNWRQAHPLYDQNARSTQLTPDHIKAAYGIELSREDFEFCQLIRMIKGDENPEKQVNLQDFEIWMEKSHKICFNTVSTLASVQRLAQYLNRVMIAVIILATIAIWLTLVTGGTKAVSLLGGTLVGLSFIFGGTCATVFNGIIFAYVIHPYDIGDICIINDTWYEVKRINLWTTTFLKVETNEVVSYPNSGLFDYPIINKTRKKRGLGGDDSIEITLESNTNEQNIMELKKEIGDYFLKEQCVQEMKKRKEELQHHIMKLCADLKIRPIKEGSD